MNRPRTPEEIGALFTEAAKFSSPQAVQDCHASAACNAGDTADALTAEYWDVYICTLELNLSLREHAGAVEWFAARGVRA